MTELQPPSIDRSGRGIIGPLIAAFTVLWSTAAGVAAAELTLDVRQVTFGPKHHCFGYIGHVQNVPWNASGRYIVALQTEFQDRMPGPEDAANIVLIDTQAGNTIRVVDRTRAWNPQQGTMLYWNPLAPETQFFFNDRDRATGRVFCVLFDISQGSDGRRIKQFRFDDTPIGNSGVAQRGGWFLGINYGRLARLRPVTGYPGAFDWTQDENHPSSDGVFKVNTATGRKQLLVSFRRLADVLREEHPDIDAKALFINHTLWSREDDRVFFFVRGDFGHRQKRVNVPMIMNPDGTGLKPLADHIGGHPEWMSGHRMIGRRGDQQFVYDTDRMSVAGVLGSPDIFPKPEGDIALSPDEQWFVNGYRQGNQNLYAFLRLSDGLSLRSGGFSVDRWTSGELRLDPGPCWNRSSDAVLVPAIADDAQRTRQLFLIRIIGQSS